MSSYEVTLEADWSAGASDGGTKDNPSAVVEVGLNGADQKRGAIRFNIAELPVDTTIISALLRVYCSSAGGAGHFVDIHPYNSDGKASDPRTDTGPNMFTRAAAGGEYINNASSLRTTGWKEYTLPAQALTDLMNARQAGTRFTFGFHEEGDDDAYAELDGTSQTNVPQLTITLFSDLGYAWEAIWDAVYAHADALTEPEEVYQGLKFPPNHFPSIFVSPGRMTVDGGSSTGTTYLLIIPVYCFANQSDITAGMKEAIRLAGRFDARIIADRDLGGTCDNTETTYVPYPPEVPIGFQRQCIRCDLLIRWYQEDE